jgi:hypothetical protein
MNPMNVITIGILLSKMREFMKTTKALIHDTARYTRSRSENEGSGRWEVISDDSASVHSGEERQRHEKEEPQHVGDQGSEKSSFEIAPSDRENEEDERPEPPPQGKDISELKEDIRKLRAEFYCLDAPRHCTRDPEVEYEEEVWIQCGVKGVIVPYRKSQGWISLRKRVIRIFKLKSQRWELKRKRQLSDGGKGWVRVEQPLRNMQDGIRYRVWIRNERKRAPGNRGGTTHGKPREEWHKYDQMQGGDLTTQTPPRPAGAPSVSTTGFNPEAEKRKGNVSLIERNEGKKPVALSQPTSKPRTETSSQFQRGTEDSSKSMPAGTTSRDGWTWTAAPEVASGTATGAREKFLAPPAEDRPQDKSAHEGKPVDEGKAKTRIPTAAEREANRLFYGTPEG